MTDELIKALWQKANGAKPDGVLFHMVRDFTAELLSASKPAENVDYVLKTQAELIVSRLRLNSPSIYQDAADIIDRLLTATPTTPAHCKKGDVREIDGRKWVCTDPEIDRWATTDASAVPAQSCGDAEQADEAVTESPKETMDRLTRQFDQMSDLERAVRYDFISRAKDSK